MGRGVGERVQNRKWGPGMGKGRLWGGEFGIKMVGSNRGKFRRVQWKQNFKDGSFNKSQIRVGGQESAEQQKECGKAEAKFAGKVKEKSKRERARFEETEKEKSEMR